VLQDVPPVIATSKYYLVSTLRENNFLLATTTAETPPLVAIEFLHRVFDILGEYFGDMEETTIKENFATGNNINNNATEVYGGRLIISFPG